MYQYQDGVRCSCVVPNLLQCHPLPVLRNNTLGAAFLQIWLGARDHASVTRVWLKCWGIVHQTHQVLGCSGAPYGLRGARSGVRYPPPEIHCSVGHGRLVVTCLEDSSTALSPATHHKTAYWWWCVAGLTWASQINDSLSHGIPHQACRLKSAHACCCSRKFCGRLHICDGVQRGEQQC